VWRSQEEGGQKFGCYFLLLGPTCDVRRIHNACSWYHFKSYPSLQKIRLRIEIASIIHENTTGRGIGGGGAVCRIQRS
jgi:hypothetical protein